MELILCVILAAFLIAPEWIGESIGKIVKSYKKTLEA